MKEYIIPLDYTWNMKISSYDVGVDRKLKLSSQLKLQQEVGELHFEQGGLGYEELYHHGFAFVLTRLNSVIYRAPVLNENIQLKTWHRGAKGVQFFRCYQFLDSEGNTLIDSVTAFALVDTAEHKLLRPKEFECFGISDQFDRLNTCPDPSRWKLPDNMQPAGNRIMRWSDIDYNGHVNNSVYADIACDVMPGGMQNKRFTEFSIAFLHEALEREQLSLQTACLQSDNGTEAWVSGKLENEQCFEARFRFVPENND